jgi:hypothetical protein
VKFTIITALCDLCACPGGLSRKDSVVVLTENRRAAKKGGHRERSEAIRPTVIGTRSFYSPPRYRQLRAGKQ